MKSSGGADSNCTHLPDFRSKPRAVRPHHQLERRPACPSSHKLPQSRECGHEIFRGRGLELHPLARLPIETKSGTSAPPTREATRVSIIAQAAAEPRVRP